MPTDNSAIDVDQWRLASRLSRHVERAAYRLPISTKCLPRAMVLQWMLHRRGIHARVVIARAINGASTPDQWHAWVEREGAMLIGQCDRKDYQPLLTIASFTGLAADAG